ncbi:MAG: nucleotidyltransferase domain-containing protein, partial [bacterium]|nr:nucleotidyltransferase domain-containing protein [bacterium]
MKTKHQIKDEKLLAMLDDIERMGTASFGVALKEIILYGSYARDRHTHESDLDIMFLFDESEEEIIKYRDRIVDIMVDLSLKYDVVVSITESSVRNFNSYVSYIPF